MQPTRRQVLRGLAGAALLAAVPACGAPFADVRLRIATGGTAGEYFRLGRALAQVWQEQLRLATEPVVLPTNGSPANVSLLTTGAAEVAVSQLDVAADRTAGSALRALAAVYNDALQIVVPAGSSIRTVTDLRGTRVSLGPENSGVGLRGAAGARRGGSDRRRAAVAARPRGLGGRATRRGDRRVLLGGRAADDHRQ